MIQRQKNPVGVSALPTGKFLRVLKFFACIYTIDPKINSKDCIGLESFQTVWKVSVLSEKFLDSLILTHSIVQASVYRQFFLYAQKLSGRAKTFRSAMPTRRRSFSASGPSALAVQPNQTKNNYTPTIASLGYTGPS